MTDYNSRQAMADGWDPEVESLDDFNRNAHGNNAFDPNSLPEQRAADATPLSNAYQLPDSAVYGRPTFDQVMHDQVPPPARQLGGPRQGYGQPPFAPPLQQNIVIQQAPKRTSHTFHLLMTIFTFGTWAPVWLIVTLVNRSK